MLYLICGLPGSGKTNFSKKLARKKRAIRFTLDEWVIGLYGSGYPAKQYPTYEKRCIKLIASVTEQLLDQGVNVILDFGFFKRKNRDRSLALAKKHKAVAKVYYLDVNDTVLKRRIIVRNKSRKMVKHIISISLLKKFIEEFEKPTKNEAIYVTSSSRKAVDLSKKSRR
jgi:predicted kinase